jgi:uncharacterized protein
LEKNYGQKLMRSLPSLIGVIHLPPLAGAPGTAGEHPASVLEHAGLLAVREARLLTQAGFEGIIIENFGDTPFYKDKVPAETIASMGIIAAAVRETSRLPLGINVLRNDARAALGIAAVTACDFIRVNVLSGVVATDQGLIEGDAAHLLRERERLGADVAILADVHVKHAKTLSSDSIALSIEETALRSRADGVIITGETTGRAVDPQKLRQASQIAKAKRIPLFIGSGVTVESLPEIATLVTGIIIGSALRKGARAGAPMEEKRLREIVKAFRSAKKRKISKK